MTPDEARKHVERRLGELGWNVHIGAAGYEKISRFAAGSDANISKLCHKLVALGALQESREITDDVVDMAVLDLGRRTGGEVSGPPAARERSPQIDRGLIDELAATLEARMAAGSASEVVAPAIRPRTFPKARAARSTEQKAAAAPLPKLILVDPDAGIRAATARALTDDFSVITATDASSAWTELNRHKDVEVLITRLALGQGDAESLVRRAREMPGHPSAGALRIIVLATPDQAAAKTRLLGAGADEFISAPIDARELRMRAVQRLQAQSRPISGDTAGAAGSAPAAPVGRARAPVETLVAERRDVGARSLSHARLSSQRAGRRSNATATITIASTVLLALAMLAIFFASHDGASLRRYFAGTTAERATDASDATRAPPAVAKPSPTEAQPPVTAPAEPEPTEAAPPAVAKPPAAPSPPTVQVAPKPAPTIPEAARPEAEAVAPPDRAESPELFVLPKADPNALDATAPSPVPPTVSTRRSVPPAAEPPPATAARAPEPEPASPSVPAPRPGAREAQAPGAAPEPEQAPAREPEQARTEQAAPRTEPARREALSADAPPTGRAEATAPLPEIARAEAPPAAVPVRPAPSPNWISREELSAFLTRFASIYEAGDLEQFMGLFADNARTNDRNDRSGIRRDYDSLFRTTDVRRLQLGEISWEVDGPQAQGWGEFNVSVRRRGDDEPYRYTGSLTFVVEKVDGRLRIVRLYHGQRRVES